MIKNAKMYDAQGYEIPGFGGYRYFVAAKDLPGVKEVFRREVPVAPEKTNQQIRKTIDEGYFGDQEALD
jgi:pre-mRNA-splicing factor ISY1